MQSTQPCQVDLEEVADRDLSYPAGLAGILGQARVKQAMASPRPAAITS